METESVQPKLLLCVSLLMALFLLGGCGATEQTEEVPECRSDAPETCTTEGEDAEDRSYNPCLINKNLPVCKS